MQRDQSFARMSRRNFLHSAAALPVVTAAPYIITSRAQAQRGPGLKIFMHWDMDGDAGIFTREQAWYWEPGVREGMREEIHELFTASVNSGTAAALEAGVTELIVCDTHHGGGNLIPDKLLKDKRVTYDLKSTGMQDGKLRWMPGLDETVQALMLPGHHAKSGTKESFLPHTWTRDNWVDFRINGQSVGEIGIETCFAGHWNIPLIYVQGDAAACEETRRQFPGTVTTCVKWAKNAELAEGVDPQLGHEETAAGIRQAIARLRTGKIFRPYKPTLPMTVTVQMTTVEIANKAAARPGVRRIDDHTVEARVARQCDIVKWLLGTGLDMKV